MYKNNIFKRDTSVREDTIAVRKIILVLVLEI